MPAPLTAADRWALTDLVLSYALAVDSGDPHRLRSVFTDDGELHTPWGTRVGLDEIIGAMASLGRHRATHHLCSPPLAEATVRGARARTWCQARHLGAGDPPRDLLMSIRYDDEMVRVGGEWRIRRRRLELAWSAQLALDEVSVPEVSAPDSA